MLDIKYIRENSDKVKEAARNKLIDVDIDRLLEVDAMLRKLNQEADKIKEERNSISSSIPKLNDKEKKSAIQHVKELKDEIAKYEEKIAPLKKEFDELMYEVPGVPLPEVPIGKTDEDNVLLKQLVKFLHLIFQ